MRESADASCGEVEHKAGLPIKAFRLRDDTATRVADA
jgi:hypothetical protein